MRDLLIYADKCKKMLDNIGIEYGNIKRFEINKTATNRWGNCKYTPTGFKIDINISLLNENNPEYALIETIIHEILHTCSGCFNHGDKWKSMVNKVNSKYKLNISTNPYSSGRQDKAKVVNYIKKNIKHKFVCTKCGQTIEYQRESDFTRNYQKYHCGICNSKFEKIF